MCIGESGSLGSPSNISIPRSAGELTDAIDLANLLERDDIRIDAPQHVADEVEPGLAAEQDVVGGDANPAGRVFSGSRHRPNLQCHGAATARRTPHRARLPRPRSDRAAFHRGGDRRGRVWRCRHPARAPARDARGPACRARCAQPVADAHRDGVNRANALARMGRGPVLRRLRSCACVTVPPSHRPGERPSNIRRSASCAPGCAASFESSGSRS